MRHKKTISFEWFDGLTIDAAMAMERVRRDAMTNQLNLKDLKHFLNTWMKLDGRWDGQWYRIKAYDTIIWLSEEEITTLINAVLSHYLTYWFINDYNIHYTIPEFMHNNYSHCSDANTKYDQYPTESEIKSMKEAEKVYQKSSKGRLNQVREYFKDPQFLENQEVTKKKDLIHLNWLEQYCNGHLELFKLTYMRKNFLQCTSKKDIYEPIADAIMQYRNGIEKVQKAYLTRENLSEVDKHRITREYVVTCMQEGLLERSFQLGYILEEAKCKMNEYPNVVKENKNLVPYFKAESFEREHYINRNDDKKRRIVNLPLNLLSQEKDVNCMFSGDTVISWYEADKRRILRRIALELQSALCFNCPATGQAMWTTKDLKDVAEFYLNDYPILNHLLQFELPEVSSIYEDLPEGRIRRSWKKNDNNFYAYVFEGYMKNFSLKESPIRIARKKIFGIEE